MRRQGKSLVRDVRKIQQLDADSQRMHAEIMNLKRDLVILRGRLTWAAHVLGIAGECLAPRGGNETARLCRIVAENSAPDQAQGVAVKNQEAQF